MSTGSVFSRGFFGQPTGTSGSSGGGSSGFVGTYTTATVAAGANNNVLPNGAGWPGTAASPYGRVDFQGAAADFSVSGLVAGLDGQIAILRNNTAFNMTLVDSGGGSASANQLAIGFDTTLAAGNSLTAVYYAGSVNKWVVQI